MITEHALLPVISGQEEDFEAAFDRARSIIAVTFGAIFRRFSIAKWRVEPSRSEALV
jgi:hypothetical protein